MAQNGRLDGHSHWMAVSAMICAILFYASPRLTKARMRNSSIIESHTVDRCLILSIAIKMVSAPPVRGVLQGGHQVSSTIVMYTEERGRGNILFAIQSMPGHCAGSFFLQISMVSAVSFCR